MNNNAIFPLTSDLWQRGNIVRNILSALLFVTGIESQRWDFLRQEIKRGSIPNEMRRPSKIRSRFGFTSVAWYQSSFYIQHAYRIYLALIKQDHLRRLRHMHICISIDLLFTCSMRAAFKISRTLVFCIPLTNTRISHLCGCDICTFLRTRRFMLKRKSVIDLETFVSVLNINLKCKEGHMIPSGF